MSSSEILSSDLEQAKIDSLLTRIEDLKSERDTYRAIAQVALERCHYLTQIVRTQRYCLTRRAFETWGDFIVHADRDIENLIAHDKETTRRKAA